MRLAAAAMALALGGCVLEDLGVGRCDLDLGLACRPGLFCNPDHTCTEAPCVPGAAAACALRRGDRDWFGQHVCSDAGWAPCRETAASLCRLPRGECTGARRLFDDTEGCTAPSYAATPDAAYAPVESCPADGKDNDCDGYSDEAGDTPASLQCGAGLCLATTDAGRLVSYRRCGEAQCPASRLAAEVPGYVPLDVCDGTDRDCSGVADVGPAVTLVEDADEVAAIRDTSLAPTAYMVATARAVPDGGRGLFVTLLGPELAPAGGAGQWLGSRATPGPFVPSFSLITSGAALVWRDGVDGVGVAGIYNGVALRANVGFTSPARVLDGPYAAEVGGKKVLAATVEPADGGKLGLLHVTALRVVNPNPFEPWAPDCSTNNCLPGVRTVVWGDGSPLGLGAITNGTLTASVLARDAGAPLIEDVGYALTPASLYSQTDLSQLFFLGGAKQARVVAIVTVIKGYQFLYLTRDQPPVAVNSAVDLSFVPEAGAFEVAARADGGPAPMMVLREGSHLVALAGVDGGAVISSSAFGQPAVAWSPQVPGRVLVATPEKRPDAGHAVVGRLVCVPK